MDNQLADDVPATIAMYRAAASGARGRPPEEPRPSAVVAWIQSAAIRIRRGGLKLQLPTALFCLASGFLWTWLIFPDPAGRSDFGHLATMPFFPAVICAQVLAGGRAGWWVVIGAVALQAVWLPPSPSLAVELHALPFFGEFLGTMAITAFGASLLDGPVHRSVARAQPLDQQFKNSQRRLVVNDAQASAVAL
jgi:hypothetical protein